MVPIIHTTDGIAMGHRPEVLGASGGLWTDGNERMRERTARPRVACGQYWLKMLLVRVRLGHPAADNPTVEAAGMRVAALSSAR
jgi:hypothetical protein